MLRVIPSSFYHKFRECACVCVCVCVCTSRNVLSCTNTINARCVRVHLFSAWQTSMHTRTHTHAHAHLRTDLQTHIYTEVRKQYQCRPLPGHDANHMTSANQSGRVPRSRVKVTKASQSAASSSPG